MLRSIPNNFFCKSSKHDLQNIPSFESKEINTIFEVLNSTESQINYKDLEICILNN